MFNIIFTEFDEKVQQSKDDAEEALKKIPEIETRIEEAEDKTREAQDNLAGAEQDAKMARDIATDAEDIAKMASDVNDFRIALKAKMQLFRTKSMWWANLKGHLMALLDIWKWPKFSCIV